MVVLAYAVTNRNRSSLYRSQVRGQLAECIVEVTQRVRLNLAGDDRVQDHRSNHPLVHRAALELVIRLFFRSMALE
jgi:hypothetical protein